jgi:hypothetical protein
MSMDVWSVGELKIQVSDRTISVGVEYLRDSVLLSTLETGLESWTLNLQVVDYLIKAKNDHTILSLTKGAAM